MILIISSNSRQSTFRQCSPLRGFLLETREEPIPRFIPEAIGVVAFPLIPLDAGRFQSRLPHPATYGIACCTFRHDIGIALLTAVLRMIESVLPVNSSLKVVILP